MAVARTGASPTPGLVGKRVLLLADGSTFVGRLLPPLRSAGVEVLTALKPAAAKWHVEGERLDGIVVLLDKMRPPMSQFLRDVRGSRLNGRVPVAIVADALDAQGIKWLAAARVDAIVVAPKSADEVMLRLASTLTPSQAPARYDVRLINCFLSAARDLFEFYLGPPLEIGRPRVKEGNAAVGFVTGLIGFSTGGQLGSIATTFERSFIDLLAAKVLGDDAGELDNAAYTDFAGEMCNQVLGKAQSNFAALGIDMRMGLPEVAIGDGHAVVHQVNSSVIMTPITHSGAGCVVEFVLGRGVSAEIHPEVAASAPVDAELFEEKAGSPAES
jgi:CheY-specific phosphatase CheX